MENQESSCGCGCGECKTTKIKKWATGLITLAALIGLSYFGVKNLK